MHGDSHSLDKPSNLLSCKITRLIKELNKLILKKKDKNGLHLNELKT